MRRECDIVLLSYENPDLLKRCVASVLEHTQTGVRLIIVDNASRNRRVKKYLDTVRGNDRVEVEKVFSEENTGYPGGMNKGIRLSDAPFVCLLNNDSEVTDGWLEEMVKVARSRDDIGLVNPQSNTFGSKPARGTSLEEHAALLGSRKGRFVELGHAVGFACLIKREVINAIGGLDEAYAGVCYEDTDFSVRAREAGFISVMAEGAYVFHVEQASRRRLKGKEEIYRRNKAMFERRWGRLLRIFFLLPRSAGDGNFMSDIYQTLKATARKGAIVDVWAGGDLAADEILDELTQKGVIKHADIGIRTVGRGPITPKVLWKVLTKKKRYDAVIMGREENALRLLKLLRLLHGAGVFSLEGEMRIRSAEGAAFDLKDPAPLVDYLRRRTKCHPRGSGDP